MIIQQIAVLVYGVLAIVAALILSSQVGSPIATALAFAAAGGTYVFQVIDLRGREAPDLLWAAIVTALLFSVLVSLWSAV